MYDKKLSVIIPTKNRQPYAFKCIETLLDYRLPGLEIVVQDNSDSDMLREMLGDRVDGVRLRYAYSAECLSFCTNFERGVELSTGDYLMMIGDDDCVFPEAVRLTDILREKEIDAAVYDTQTSYLWPNAIAKSAGGRLVVRKQKNCVKQLSTAHALREMVTSGFYDYQAYPFPKVYHGIVKREKFDRVKEKTGHYFGGLTPDIYGAVALSFYIDRMLYLSTPFSLPGTCAKSGSADSLTGRHTGELSDAPHFRGHTDYHWDSEIPYVYSVDTIWAESAFKAVKENGGNISLSPAELFAFLAHILKRCPAFEERLAGFYKEKTGADVNQTQRKLRHAAAKLSRKSFVRKRMAFALQLVKGRYVYQDVADIQSAVSLAGKRLKQSEKVLEKAEKTVW